MIIWCQQLSCTGVVLALMYLNFSADKRCYCTEFVLMFVAKELRNIYKKIKNYIYDHMVICLSVNLESVFAI